jgi:hypothetical protein
LLGFRCFAKEVKQLNGISIGGDFRTPEKALGSWSSANSG